MKVTCSQEHLAKGLSIVRRSVANRSTLPILGNVLLATENGKLKLSATNLELGINCWIDAKIEAEGAITVPARLLDNFISSLPAKQVDLVLDEETKTLEIQCAHFDAKLNGIEALEFPMVSHLTGVENVIYIASDTLKRLINQVCFAAANDESRPILTGALAQFGPDTLTLLSADGFRMAQKTVPLSQPIATNIEVVVPAHSLIELARIISHQDAQVQITITPNANQILFHINNIEVVSQLLAGQYPNLSQVVPKDHLTHTVLSTAAFRNAVQVSHFFSNDFANNVMLDMRPGDGELNGGTLVLSAVSPDLGETVSALQANVRGEPVEIYFNTRYLADILSVLDSTHVALETTTATGFGRIYPVGDESLNYVIAPISPSAGS